SRFATKPVVDALFSVPFSGDEGSFRGCTPDGELFICRYGQVANDYEMVVQRDPRNGSFVVVRIVVRSTGQTTTTTTAPTSTTSSTTTSSTPPVTLNSG